MPSTYCVRSWRAICLRQLSSLSTPKAMAIFRPISRFISKVIQDRAYYGTLIGTRMPFLVTSNDPNPDSLGHDIIWRWMSQKRYEIETLLQWNTYNALLRGVISNDLEWLLVTQWNIQWHEASCGLSAAVRFMISYFCIRQYLDSWKYDILRASGGAGIVMYVWLCAR